MACGLQIDVSRPSKVINDLMYRYLRKYEALSSTYVVYDYYL